VPAIDLDGRIRPVLSRSWASALHRCYLRSDNGPEFMSRALLYWIAAQGIDTALIEPGKQWAE
jgi:putative transposase